MPAAYTTFCTLIPKGKADGCLNFSVFVSLKVISNTIETVFPAFQNLTGLAAYAKRGMCDGFVGMMAIHPNQIAIINEAFTPSAEALEHARAVVALFDANPGAGALSLNGSMVDAPHLKLALRLLRQANA